MRNFLLEFYRIMIVAFVAGFIAANCFAQPTIKSNEMQKSDVKRFLLSYFGIPSDEMDKETRYSAAFVDLKGNGSQEVIVYLTGPSWCGSGGCTMLILAPEGKSYKVVTKTTITRLPIRILKTKSNGWYDISVEAREEGEVKLSYDGITYPTNPTTPPSRQLSEKVLGRVLISPDAEDRALF